MLAGKQIAAIKQKDKAMPVSGGHFEKADNGGYMLTMHSKDGMGSSMKTVHPTKKHMLKHLDAALPEMAGTMPMRKSPGNLIKGPGRY